MKLKYLGKVALIFSLLVGGLFAAPVPGKKFGSLTVHIKGMKTSQGPIYLGLVREKKNWLNRKAEPFRTAVGKIHNLHSTVVFENLPPGEYAVSLFHDVNSNDTLDTNTIGLPKEPYGFSCNPRIFFGPPSFKRAKFSQKEQGTSITIKLK